MASTFSDRLGIELIGDGEQSNSWGTTTNNNFGNIFDEAISGFLSIDLGSQSSPYALSFNNGPVTRATQQDRQAVLRFHNTSSAFIIQVNNNTSPNNTRERIFRIINDCTNTLQLKQGTSGNTSDLIPAGSKAIIATDGTNFYTIVTSTGGAGTATAVNTTTFTAVAGQRLLINTSNTGGGANAPITVTLPAPGASTVGDQIGFLDIADHFDTNALTINPNGGKVFGATANGTVSTEGAGFTLIFTGTDFGWKIMEK